MTDSFKEMYEKQSSYQSIVTGISTPIEDSSWSLYHNTALMEEIGEFIKADKRWKTHRNKRYDKNDKLEEWADVMIEVMNLAIFSGFTCKELCDIIDSKMQSNLIKYLEEDKE